jgi:uncharacterized protein (TIGR02147 family)
MSQDLSPESLSSLPPREGPIAGTSQSARVPSGAVPSAPAGAKDQGASVFDFTDYREYLRAFYEAKRAANPLYTMSTFTRRAGFGENSRGYLKLVIEGKRNLTPATLRRFIDALGVKGRDALYFENLVYFNQAQTAKDKEYYFERLSASAEGHESKQFEVLRSQYQFYTNWYYVAVRELVAHDEFVEDPAWIASHLRGKVNRAEAQAALRDLAILGLVRRNATTQKLEQCEPLVKYTGGVFNETIRKFHVQMMDRAREALVEDDFSESSASCITMCCDRDSLPALIKSIAEFRDQAILKFGARPNKSDAVIQLNFQLFQLTSPQAVRKGRTSSTNPTPKPDSKENGK